MRFQMDNCPTIFQQHYFAVKWIGIAIMTLSTVGFTAQSPASEVTRRSPPAACTPAMGWNSFWPFQCGSNVKEDDLKKQADLLAEKGLVKAGYTTFIVECGWESDPSDDGSPKSSQQAFKEGLRPFSDYLRSKGLNLGLGTWAGKQLCPRNPNEKFRGDDPPKDLKLYISKLVEWGMAYMSHRPCDLAPPDRLQYPDQASELNSRYVQMEDAVRDAGAKIFYATG